MSIVVNDFTVTNLGGEYLLSANYTITNAGQEDIQKTMSRRISAGPTKTQLDTFMTKLLAAATNMEGVSI